MGFVFGYLLYSAERHTKEFSIEMLSVTIGAVSSATVLFEKLANVGILSKILLGAPRE
jgi:hypothetical protein